MRTVSVSEDRPAGQAYGGDVAKLPASAPRGVIGTGLLFLVSLFLLAAGAVPSLPAGDSAEAGKIGAFLLDPSVTPAS